MTALLAGMSDVEPRETKPLGSSEDFRQSALADAEHIKVDELIEVAESLLVSPRAHEGSAFAMPGCRRRPVQRERRTEPLACLIGFLRASDPCSWQVSGFRIDWPSGRSCRKLLSPRPGIRRCQVPRSPLSQSARRRTCDRSVRACGCC